MNVEKFSAEQASELIRYMEGVDELQKDNLKCKLVSDYMFLRNILENRLIIIIETLQLKLLL